MRCSESVAFGDMNKPHSLKYLTLVFCFGVLISKAAITVDFSSETIEDQANGYLGGWFGNPMSFDQWYGASSDASISGGQLNVTTTSGYRGAVLLLDSSAFEPFGAGSYTLTYDVTSFSLSNGASTSADDFAEVRIWSGSGYDLTNTTGNALSVSPQNGSFTAQGTATVNLLASGQVNSTGIANTLQFEYDGTSAIGLFFGAITGNWPFPDVSYDNLSIGPVAVPEPGSIALYCGLLTGGLIMLRRRWMSSQGNQG
jgi:hypothetical protein